ncbi:MAG: DUF488 domain-containing protein [Eubacterium sp.]|nr:DUF488 domain-containing protein [Eubacterium sp.]
MIYLGNILHLNPCEYDEVWVICHSVEEIRDMIDNNKNVFHVPELAPSKELFERYRALVHLDRWDREAFLKYYVPTFLENIQRNDEAIKLLKHLVNESEEKNIMLTCFCEDESICHRSIIGGILKNFGASIICNPEYEVYSLA